MTREKPFPITKRQVWEAYKRVKANHGGAGVDEQSLAEFAEDLENNLYKLWNRLASGSYLPPPVKRVDIPKAGGGVRPLGVPTVADRIAQTVVKQALEPGLESHFHPDSYGYRPDKSAHQAIGQARQRCWRYDWVVDLDIKGFLDRCSYYPPADAGSSKRSRVGFGTLILRPLRLPCETWMASSSPRLTRCNTVWRDTPSRRMASTMGT